MSGWELALGTLSALGTLGAAALAAWSAVSAKTAAQASRDLAEIEAARDDLAWRCVSVELGTTDLTIEGEAGHVGRTVVTNSGPYPLHRVRLWMRVGGVDWGPQLMGDLQPGRSIELVAFVPGSRPDNDTNAWFRFTDAFGTARLASARGTVTEVDSDPTEWVEAGREFASRSGALSIYERGTAVGPTPSEFDAVEWAEAMAFEHGGH